MESNFDLDRAPRYFNKLLLQFAPWSHDLYNNKETPRKAFIKNYFRMVMKQAFIEHACRPGSTIEQDLKAAVEQVNSEIVSKFKRPSVATIDQTMARLKRKRSQTL